MATSLAASSKIIRFGPWNETFSFLNTAPLASLNVYAKLCPGIRLLKFIFTQWSIGPEFSDNLMLLAERDISNGPRYGHSDIETLPLLMKFQQCISCRHLYFPQCHWIWNFEWMRVHHQQMPCTRTHHFQGCILSEYRHYWLQGLDFSRWIPRKTFIWDYGRLLTVRCAAVQVPTYSITNLKIARIQFLPFSCKNFVVGPAHFFIFDRVNVKVNLKFRLNYLITTVKSFILVQCLHKLNSYINDLGSEDQVELSMNTKALDNNGSPNSYSQGHF